MNKCLNCGEYVKNKFCNPKCQKNYYYKSYIESWKKCSKCGWCEVNPYTGKIHLEIEHIDGDSTNNKEENLDLLCPNCHSLTSTYKALNKGRGRGKTWIPKQK